MAASGGERADPQPIRRQRRRVAWGHVVRWSAIGLVAFLLLALVADDPVSRTMRDWPQVERQFFRWLTRWGEADWMVIPPLLIMLVAWLAKLFGKLDYTWRWGLSAASALSRFVFFGVAVPGLTAALFKRLFGRARPVHIDELGTLYFEPGSFLDYSLQGFPSGHATSAFAFATVLAILAGWRWGIVFFGVAAMIAISRIVVGAHYLSDVLAGGLLGTTGAVFVKLWFQQRGMFGVPERGETVRPFVPLKRLFRRYFAR